MREVAEENKDELWSSLFDPFRQIGGEWRKSRVLNVHRNYCTWEKENIVLYQINLFCENCDFYLGELINPRQNGNTVNK